MNPRDAIRDTLKDWERENPQGQFHDWLADVEAGFARDLWRAPLRKIRAWYAFYSRQKDALLRGYPHLRHVYSPTRYADRLFALYEAYLEAAATEMARRSRSGQPKLDGRPDHGTPSKEKARGTDGFLGRHEFTHSDSYRSIMWDGENHTLTPRQAQVVKILHEAHAAGLPDVGKDRILEELGSPSSRLRDSFKGSRLWGTLIVKGERRDTYRLSLSDPNPAQ